MAIYIQKYPTVQRFTTFSSPNTPPEQVFTAAINTQVFSWFGDLTVFKSASIVGIVTAGNIMVYDATNAAMLGNFDGASFTDTISIIDYPNITVACRVVSAFQPIEYSVWRQSEIVTISNNGSGKIRCTVISTAALTSGDYVWFNNLRYKGVYQLTIINGTTFDITSLTYNTGYGTYAVVAYVDADYLQTATITYTDDNGTTQTITAKAVPYLGANAEYDFSGVIQKTLSFKSNYNYSDAKATNNYVSKEYSVIFSDNDSGTTTAHEFVGAFANVEVGDYSVLWQYTALDVDVLGVDYVPKSKFANVGTPQIYVDNSGYVKYPFSLSFYDDTTGLNREVVQKSVSGSTISTTSTTLTPNSDGILTEMLVATKLDTSCVYVNVALTN